MARACPVCGSRRWRRDNVTGSAVCEDGHVYQDYRVENQDADGPSQYALQRRKIRTGTRGQKNDKAGANELYYHGDDAEYLRLQALQLLLRYQFQALRKLWDLPDVFEMVTRDIWAYQLSVSRLPPPPEENTPQSRAGTPLHLRQTVSGLTVLDGAGSDLHPGDRDEGSPEKEDSTESDKSDGQDSEEQLLDPDLLEEMSHLSELTDKEENPRPRGRTSLARRARKVKASDTLVVLLLGLWVVRQGILCMDLETIVNTNVIPYLDFAHTTLLPAEMVKRMNRDVVLSLSPQRSPKPMYLFGAMRRLARRLQVDYGIPIPEVNLPRLSWRVLGGLGGTPITHMQVMRLLDLVDISTSLTDASITTRQRKQWGSQSRRNSLHHRGRSRTTLGLGDDEENGIDGLGHESSEVPLRAGPPQMAAAYTRTDKNMDVIMPELVIVAGWLVVMKMCYGLDDVFRQVMRSEAMDEPMIGASQASELVEELQTRYLSGTLNPHTRELARRDLSSLPAEELDRYLNLAKDVLLKDRPASDANDYQTFPLTPKPEVPAHAPPPTSWRHFHSAALVIPSTPPPLKPGTGIPPEPGQQLRSYDAKDTSGTYPPAYEVCLRSAAASIGVDIKDVAEVVQLIERRLEKVRKGRRISMRGKYGKGRPKGDTSKSRSRTDLARLRDSRLDTGYSSENDTDA